MEVQEQAKPVLEQIISPEEQPNTEEKKSEILESTEANPEQVNQIQPKLGQTELKPGVIEIKFSSGEEKPSEEIIKKLESSQENKDLSKFKNYKIKKIQLLKKLKKFSMYQENMNLKKKKKISGMI